MTRARRWCFTYNNPPDNWEELASAYFDEPQNRIKFMIFQLEWGEKNQTRHFQGYLEFNVKKTLKSLQNLFGNGLHFEVARGTKKQNIAYCSKGDGNPFIFGDVEGGQGSRTDLIEFVKAIDENSTFTSMVEEYPVQMVKYYRFFDRYKIEMQNSKVDGNKREKKWVACLYGATGTGKTRHVYDNNSNVYEVEIGTGNSVWFDGYCGQDVVLFDDYRGGIPMSTLLRIIDRGPHFVQCKGNTHLQFNPKKIYFTSNNHPWDWYKNCDQSSRKALMRRFTAGVIEKIMNVPLNEIELTEEENVEENQNEVESEEENSGKYLFSSLGLSDIPDLPDLDTDIIWN